MVNRSKPEAQVFAGIDVSARELSVAVRCGTEDRAVTTFGNNAAGHKALLAYLLRGNGRSRVCLEASGNYSLDLALTLQAHRQVEVSVVNPRRARRFAESLGERSKTDPVDAGVLCEYAARMPWVAWQPPSSLALRLIARDCELDRRFRLMLTVPGIGQTSALQILGELVVLPDTLDARQWVAFSGIDPSQFTSGTSVQKRPRISRGGSRHLRRALYMPALVAVRHAPHLRAFYQRLPSRGKARIQAVVAVMRKLLHALFAMFRSNQSYDGSKLCPIELTNKLAAVA